MRLCKVFITRMLAGLALFVALSANSGSVARANFTVALDCTSSPAGYPEWAGSSNTTTVYAKINNAWVKVGAISMGSAAPCSTEWTVAVGTSPWAASDVQAVRITHSGSDTVWFDRVGLRDANGNFVAIWGVNNLVGYCFSTQASDGNNAYCWNNTAYSQIDFNR